MESKVHFGLHFCYFTPLFGGERPGQFVHIIKLGL